MTNRFCLACLAVCLLALPCLADSSETLPWHHSQTTRQSGLNTCVAADNCGDHWGTFEFVSGWLQHGPLPVPLVTGGALADPLPAAIGQPGTQILFGDQPIDFGTFSGFRGVMGTWLDDCHTVGVEASGFLMENRTSGFSVDNVSGPSEVVTLPIQLPTGEETSVFALVTRQPGAPLPSTTIRTLSSSQLWGAELNLVSKQVSNSCRSVEGLWGFRHINLDESLGILVDLSRPVGNETAMTSGRDVFEARSRFYGSHFGLRATQRYHRALFTVTGKLAIGANVDVVKIAGSRTQMNPGQPPVTTEGFVFAEPTNIGRVSKTRFAVAPEVRVSCSYDLTPRLAVHVGYEVLYWNQVVRPGNQIDRVVNPTQRGGGQLVGAPRPDSRFKTSDLVFQSLSCGLQYTY